MSQTPAGWYVDAQGTTRWWDGVQWTEHTQPPVPQAPAEPAAPEPAVSEPAPESVESQSAGPDVPEEPEVSAPVEEFDDRTRIRPAFDPGETGQTGQYGQSGQYEQSGQPGDPGASVPAPVDDAPTYLGDSPAQSGSAALPPPPAWTPPAAGQPT
ncbi:MAG: DUF2510 domain-containing protein, partial [Nocardioides sp.]|uniref:DUF2510 domain-containing protein n=1 Tax=Nocardioides sp. TaxID=35761 RepID=UPI0039E2DB25